ncbi:ATP-binding protein [Desulforhopalus singaporensis]|uniref:histidine kinase n=1 Tax=Desulforhopalus singaporensis TaxID=91360 RepID=A0A1H0SSU1_9BACT|nr:ATP-binding protein [Desulforhopalus singaporensis]SDP44852.1 His Kinase A (phospho-acceptor) domain-containing protein [Desulforhopalus singaporensis]
MLNALSLRAKIGCSFGALALVVLLSGGCMFWYTYRIDTMMKMMVKNELVLYKTLQDIAFSLANQKGFVTYFTVDKDEKWLKLLTEYRQAFNRTITQAQQLKLTPEQRRNLETITQKYNAYSKKKDAVIQSYRKQHSDGTVSSLHEIQRRAFFEILQLCRTFSEDQWQVILRTQQTSNTFSQKLRVVAFTTIALFGVISVIFLAFLYHHILAPIRGLAIETGRSPQESSRDEVNSLAHSFKDIMKDLGETSEELARSRRNLLQAEKMAMVGELAAGVAHTIRNPFTSIKMRMFSLDRSFKLNDTQNDDLQVISDEITRIDRILENFLEFSRPPKLVLKQCNISDIIRSVLILLEYRLKSYKVTLHYIPQDDLPTVKVDNDRIKEALVNIIINSCEAMENGGKIVITERLQQDPQAGEVLAVAIKDDGPGIPKEILDKIITPFYTTKEAGSGLGLSIVDRIAQEHNGRFIVTSQQGQGAECTILLPTRG